MAAPRSEIVVRSVAAGEAEALVPRLAQILTDCVDGGASIGFMASFSRSEADAFWRGVLPAIAAGERVLLVAELDGVVVGTVQVVLALPPNQPHRGELTKMLVHRDGRERGVGAKLLAAAERIARERGKSLLVLDTFKDTAAYRLYRRCGWSEVGVIPRFALWPDGRFGDTVVFYKDLDGRAAA
jgi:GNAT superfamily N-acetyltransferase